MPRASRENESGRRRSDVALIFPETKLALKLVEVYESPELVRNPALLDRSATALDKNSQHDHKQNAGNNPNERNVVHDKPLSLQICAASSGILNPRVPLKTCAHRWPDT